ncbi:hypothetical protein EBR43_04540 [bacterium]|nr:hypothetical protein [bacterium]NBW57045.1 hypothetical protein [bacterium]NBX72507.1 hypothetical protein [bacterium]
MKKKIAVLGPAFTAYCIEMALKGYATVESWEPQIQELSTWQDRNLSSYTIFDIGLLGAPTPQRSWIAQSISHKQLIIKSSYDLNQDPWYAYWRGETAFSKLIKKLSMQAHCPLDSVNFIEEELRVLNLLAGLLLIDTQELLLYSASFVISLLNCFDGQKLHKICYQSLRTLALSRLLVYKYTDSDRIERSGNKIAIHNKEYDGLVVTDWSAIKSSHFLSVQEKKWLELLKQRKCFMHLHDNIKDDVSCYVDATMVKMRLSLHTSLAVSRNPLAQIDHQQSVVLPQWPKEFELMMAQGLYVGTHHKTLYCPYFYPLILNDYLQAIDHVKHHILARRIF